METRQLNALLEARSLADRSRQSRRALFIAFVAIPACVVGVCVVGVVLGRLLM